MPRWAIITILVLIVWLLLDPAGLAGTLSNLGHAFGTFRNALGG